MNDLGPKELELLSALRANDEPELADRERIRRRVWLAVGLAAVGTSGVGIGTQTAVAATPKLGLLAAAKVGIVVSLAAGGAVFATQQWSAAEHMSSASSVAAPRLEKPEHVAVQPEPSVNLVEPVVSVQPADATLAPIAGPRSRSKSETSAASNGADLDGEIKLLRQARQALQSGQFTAALSSLEEHARLFPRGVLASERQASMAIALCRSGQVTTGKARAARYLDRNPNSPLADRVRASCKLD